MPSISSMISWFINIWHDTLYYWDYISTLFLASITFRSPAPHAYDAESVTPIQLRRSSPFIYYFCRRRLAFTAQMPHTHFLVYHSSISAHTFSLMRIIIDTRLSRFTIRTLLIWWNSMKYMPPLSTSTRYLLRSRSPLHHDDWYRLPASRLIYMFLL